MHRGIRHPALADNSWNVMAHRGGSSLRPGNTMTAFRNAAELGVDALEMDVHATRDGVLVVIHDDTVDRTTNGSGRVSDFTLQEIRELDAAYNWPFTKDGERPFRGTGVRIPTLEEVFQAFPAMPMVIDMKQEQPSIFETFGQLCQQYDRAKNTIVGSFHSAVLRAFRKMFPEFATSGSQPEVLRFLILNKLFLGRLARPAMDALEVPERARTIRVVERRFLRVARSHGIAVHVWTVNETVDMKRMLAAGVDGIISDRPDQLLELEGR